MTPLEYLQAVGKNMNKPKRYMITFEKDDGTQLPIIMEGTSPENAVDAIFDSRPYLDVRDYSRYTWKVVG